MAEILIGPDVVALLCAYLTQQLPAIPNQSALPVVSEVPDPRPAAFVVVQGAPGGGRAAALPVVDQVPVIIDCWAPAMEQAHDLAQNTRALVLAAQGVVVGGTQVYRVSDGGVPAPLPDPLSNTPRYRFLSELTVRVRRPQ